MSQCSYQVLALRTTNDPTGLRSVLHPRDSLFGVNKSRLCKSPVILPKTKGTLLIVFDVCAARVSHCKTEKCWFSKFFSVESLIWQNFLSTMNMMNCSRTHFTFYFYLHQITSTKRLPSSGRSFFAYSNSHANRMNNCSWLWWLMLLYSKTHISILWLFYIDCVVCMLWIYLLIQLVCNRKQVLSWYFLLIQDPLIPSLTIL